MKRIVLTGGPCAGKTTALSYLQKKLSERGVSVVVVPEVPTMVINSGIDPTKLDPEQHRRFEELLLRTQIRFENDVFATVARIKNGKKTVMICDRGCMDMSAYMTEQVFEQILRENHFSRVSLRDRRYDAVFHRTEKSPTDSAMSRIEIERQISYVEYYRARQLRDPRWDVIEKYRCCFLWHNQYFELDSFIKPERHRGLKMLEIELTAETDPVSLPGWLGKVTEVTEDPKFRNSHLAKRP